MDGWMDVAQLYKLSEEEAASQKSGHAQASALRRLVPSVVVGGLST